MDKISHEMRLAQWTSIIRECNSSGLSKKSWITANGIDEKQFYYWQRRVREEVFQELQPSLSPTQTFVELNVPSSTTSHSERPEAILRIGNCVLELQNTLSPILLQTIMQVMIHAE